MFGPALRGVKREVRNIAVRVSRPKIATMCEAKVEFSHYDEIDCFEYLIFFCYRVKQHQLVSEARLGT